MAKLNQIIAIQAGKKSQAKEALTEAYHQMKKSDLFNGLVRTYQPRDEGGEPQPEERKLVQSKVSELVERVKRDLTEMFDVVATQDWANCTARADVVVDGRKVLEQVPVTHLLFLEKQLVDLRTFVESLPLLDTAEEWEYKPEFDCFASRPSRSNRSKKVPKNHIKYEATKEHPAQVEMYMEDVWVGTWTTTKFSGAVPAATKNGMLERIRKLADAVKLAREEANNIEVKSVRVGAAVLGYVLDGR
ncbi:MAG: hypothetical protein ACJ8DJ_04670 [Gemmatimonadales bacterium]